MFPLERAKPNGIEHDEKCSVNRPNSVPVLSTSTTRTTVYNPSCPLP